MHCSCCTIRVVFCFADRSLVTILSWPPGSSIVYGNTKHYMCEHQVCCVPAMELAYISAIYWISCPWCCRFLDDIESCNTLKKIKQILLYSPTSTKPKTNCDGWCHCIFQNIHICAELSEYSVVMLVIRPSASSPSFYDSRACPFPGQDSIMQILGLDFFGH